MFFPAAWDSAEQLAATICIRTAKMMQLSFEIFIHKLACPALVSPFYIYFIGRID
jgi:hypothetical protein